MTPNQILIGKIIERALQLEDEKLTSLMMEAGWIRPFEFSIDLSNVEVLRALSVPESAK